METASASPRSGGFQESVSKVSLKSRTESSYFQVVIGSKYAKLKLEDGIWEDGRSKAKFTLERLKKAIADDGETAQ